MYILIPVFPVTSPIFQRVVQFNSLYCGNSTYDLRHTLFECGIYLTSILYSCMQKYVKIDSKRLLQQTFGTFTQESCQKPAIQEVHHAGSSCRENRRFAHGTVQSARREGRLCRGTARGGAGGAGSAVSGLQSAVLDADDARPVRRDSRGGKAGGTVAL